MDVGTRYLARLGLTGRPPATLAGLHQVHRAHVARIPYDNGPEQLTVRGLVHQVLTPTSRDQRDLASYDQWSSLWDRTVAAHRARDEAGRP